MKEQGHGTVISKKYKEEKFGRDQVKRSAVSWKETYWEVGSEEEVTPQTHCIG